MCFQMTVEAVKDKLWKKCGTSVNSMSLELYDETGAKISVLSDNARPLGFYSPLDGLVKLFWSEDLLHYNYPFIDNEIFVVAIRIISRLRFVQKELDLIWTIFWINQSAFAVIAYMSLILIHHQ